MMNSISRPMAFTFAVATIVAATIAAANSASAQQIAMETVALEACNDRATAPSSHADQGSRHSARAADSSFNKPAVLAMSKEGLVRRTSVSLVSAAQADGGEITEELSSQPQACYPPPTTTAPKVVDC